MIKRFREDVIKNNTSSMESYSKVGLIKVNDVIYLYLQYRVFGDNGINLIQKYSINEMFLISDFENLESILENILDYVPDIEGIKESYQEALDY